MARKNEDIGEIGPETFAFSIGDLLLKINEVCAAAVRVGTSQNQVFSSLSMLVALVMEYSVDDVKDDVQFHKEMEELGMGKPDSANIDPEDWNSIVKHLRVTGSIARSLRRQGIIGHRHMEVEDITPDLEAAAIDRGWGPNPKTANTGTVA